MIAQLQLLIGLEAVRDIVTNPLRSSRAVLCLHGVIAALAVCGNKGHLHPPPQYGSSFLDLVLCWLDEPPITRQPS